MATVIYVSFFILGMGVRQPESPRRAELDPIARRIVTGQKR
tara:strand:+ start:36900 stop:37022 length:123 start_codon:yes stop_codon:yes gene_type:complete